MNKFATDKITKAKVLSILMTDSICSLSKTTTSSQVHRGYFISDSELASHNLLQVCNLESTIGA